MGVSPGPPNHSRAGSVQVWACQTCQVWRGSDAQVWALIWGLPQHLQDTHIFQVFSSVFWL